MTQDFVNAAVKALENSSPNHKSRRGAAYKALVEQHQQITQNLKQVVIAETPAVETLTEPVKLEINLELLRSEALLKLGGTPGPSLIQDSVWREVFRQLKKGGFLRENHSLPDNVLVTDELVRAELFSPRWGALGGSVTVVSPEASPTMLIFVRT
jgi:hypothetical protein